MCESSGRAGLNKGIIFGEVKPQVLMLQLKLTNLFSNYQWYVLPLFFPSLSHLFSHGNKTTFVSLGEVAGTLILLFPQMLPDSLSSSSFFCCWVLNPPPTSGKTRAITDTLQTQNLKLLSSALLMTPTHSMWLTLTGTCLLAKNKYVQRKMSSICSLKNISTLIITMIPSYHCWGINECGTFGNLWFCVRA